MPRERERARGRKRARENEQGSQVREKEERRGAIKASERASLTALISPICVRAPTSEQRAGVHFSKHKSYEISLAVKLLMRRRPPEDRSYPPSNFFNKTLFVFFPRPARAGSPLVPPIPRLFSPSEIKIAPARLEETKTKKNDAPRFSSSFFYPANTRLPLCPLPLAGGGAGGFFLHKEK